MLYKFILSTSFAFLMGFFSCSANAATEPKQRLSDATSDTKTYQVRAPDIHFDTLRDPFASYLLTVALRGKQLLEAQQSQLANREREALEVFDLSTLSLVGIFKMGDKRVAMIQDSQGKGYTVTQGNYMGKNNGKIERIDDDTVYLVESLLDSKGLVVKEPTTLTIKEVNDSTR